MFERRKRTAKLMKSIAPLAALALLSAFGYIFIEGQIGDIVERSSSYYEGSYKNQQVMNWNEYNSLHTRRHLDEISEDTTRTTVCGRVTNAAKSGQDLALQQKLFANCPGEDDPSVPILVLEGHYTFGRTGNQLRSFLRAFQFAKDNHMQLGIMYHSWATEVLLQFFMAKDVAENQADWANPADWVSHIEKALCVKIIHKADELKERKIVLKSPFDLFYYHSKSPMEEYVASQEYHLKTLFYDYNTGQRVDQDGKPVQDMCTAIDSLFGEVRSTVKYTVIHQRHLEGTAGLAILGGIANASGCDKHGALDMMPNYVKSILEPLDMLKHPIVLITDNQNQAVTQRLMDDPDIGKVLRFVPEPTVGGDITLAIMADVFVGNPASTISSFVAQSRVSLGLGHTYLYRAKDKDGKWYSVCDDSCFFRRTTMPGQGTGRYYRNTWKNNPLLVKTSDRKRLGAYGMNVRLDYSSMMKQAKSARESMELRRMALKYIADEPKEALKYLGEDELKARSHHQSSAEQRRMAMLGTERKRKVYPGLRPDERAKVKSKEM